MEAQTFSLQACPDRSENLTTSARPGIIVPMLAGQTPLACRIQGRNGAIRAPLITRNCAGKNKIL
jgi:hypothetical protein